MLHVVAYLAFAGLTYCPQTGMDEDTQKQDVDGPKAALEKTPDSYGFTLTSEVTGAPQRKKGGKKGGGNKGNREVGGEFTSKGLYVKIGSKLEFVKCEGGTAVKGPSGEWQNIEQMQQKGEGEEEKGKKKKKKGKKGKRGGKRNPARLIQSFEPPHSVFAKIEIESTSGSEADGDGTVYSVVLSKDCLPELLGRFARLAERAEGGVLTGTAKVTVNADGFVTQLQTTINFKGEIKGRELDVSFSTTRGFTEINSKESTIPDEALDACETQ